MPQPDAETEAERETQEEDLGQITSASIALVQSLRLQFVWETECWPSSNGELPLGKTPVETFACVQALLRIIRDAKIRAARWSWGLTFNYHLYQTNTPKVTFHVNSKGVEVKGHHPGLKVAEDSIRSCASSLRQARKSTSPHQLQASRLARWSLFETVTLVAYSLDQLDVAFTAAKTTITEVPLAPWTYNKSDCTRIMASARFAQVCGDVATLELLLQSLKDLWLEYRVRVMDPRHSAVDHLLSQPTLNITESNVDQALETLASRHRLEWPDPHFPRGFPADAQIEDDGVYEWCEVDGKKMYRLITPSRASWQTAIDRCVTN